MARDWYEIKVSFEPLSDGRTNARACYTGRSGRLSKGFESGGIMPKDWTGGRCAIGASTTKKSAATVALRRLRKTAPTGGRFRVKIKR